MKQPEALCLVLLLLGAAGSCTQRSSSAPAVEIVRVQRRELPSEIMARGAVRPEVGAEIRVGPRLSGVLRRLYVRVGDQVRRGQLLAELDHTHLDAAIGEAEAGLAEATAQAELAESQLARRQALAREGLVAVEELEAAQKAARVAAARLQRARAQLETVKIERSYAVIRAPMAGTVTSIATREGETVAASFAVPTFLTITDLNRLQVEAYVDEVDIGRVAVGQSARFTVDAFPSEEFDARVTAIIPQATTRENVVSYTVFLAITGGNKQLLRPDMSAFVAIVTGSHQEALVLPARAIQRDAEGQPYVLIEEAGKQVRRQVSIGEMVGGYVRIRAGLAEGDGVVVPKGEETGS